MKVGVDLDGVICSEPKWMDWFYLLNTTLAVSIRDRWVKPLYVPRKDSLVIITGRPHEDCPSTVSWLARHNIKHAGLYLNPKPPSVSGSISWKHTAILDLKIDLYIESDYFTALILERLTGKRVITPREGGVLEWLKTY